MINEIINDIQEQLDLDEQPLTELQIDTIREKIYFNVKNSTDEMLVGGRK